MQGTIKDPLEGVIRGVNVTFQHEQMSKTVSTNDVGVYEADLPLGDYTMTAQGPRGFRIYPPTTFSCHFAGYGHAERHAVRRRPMQ